MPASLAAPPVSQRPGALPRRPQDYLGPGGVQRTPDTLAELAAVQPLKQEAFTSWTPTATWFAWCSTTGTTVTMNDSAWTSWNTSVTSTTGSLAYNCATNTAYISSGSAWIAWNGSYQESEDQRAERERQVAEANARWEEQRARQAREAAARQLEREQAQARALGLLRSLLSDAQWASYQENGWFEVRGKSGRRWRVRDAGQAGNVDLMPEAGEERDATYCAHPPEGLPDADAHAAQMLALVTDDEAFTRAANCHYRKPGTAPPFMRVAA